MACSFDTPRPTSVWIDCSGHLDDGCCWEEGAGADEAGAEDWGADEDVAAAGVDLRARAEVRQISKDQSDKEDIRKRGD